MSGRTRSGGGTPEFGTPPTNQPGTPEDLEADSDEDDGLLGSEGSEEFSEEEADTHHHHHKYHRDGKGESGEEGSESEVSEEEARDPVDSSEHPDDHHDA